MTGFPSVAAVAIGAGVTALFAVGSHRVVNRVGERTLWFGRARPVPVEAIRDVRLVEGKAEIRRLKQRLRGSASFFGSSFDPGPRGILAPPGSEAAVVIRVDPQAGPTQTFPVGTRHPEELPAATPGPRPVSHRPPPMLVRADRSGQRILYRERLGLLPRHSVRVGERTIRVGRAVVPVDAVTGIELLHGAVLVRAGTSSWLLKTRRPHELLAALREAVAHGLPTAEQLAAATAERTAQPPPDPVLYEERQAVGRLRRSRVVRVCERTLRISGRAPIRLEWISEVRLLDGDEAERAVQERRRALDALAAADRAGDLGARQLSHWYDVLREDGSPDDGGCLWEPGLPGAVYLEVEAGASPVHAWLVGSRDPARLHRALADAVAARKHAYGEVSLESVGRRPDDPLL